MFCCRDVKTGFHCFSFLKGKWRQVATLVPSDGFFVKIENEMKKNRIPKVCMEATISILLCSFAWMMSLMLGHSLMIQSFGTF